MLTKLIFVKQIRMRPAIGTESMSNTNYSQYIWHNNDILVTK